MKFPIVCRAIALTGIACIAVGVAHGSDARPARPGFAIPRPSASQAKALAQTGRLPAPPPIIIRGGIGNSILVTPNRTGVTYAGSTMPFTKTAMPRQIDGSLPHTRKFGDGTVIAGPDRQGVTHAGKTFPFGAEVGTLRTGWPNTGLTTIHTPGRVWSSFRKAQ